MPEQLIGFSPLLILLLLMYFMVIRPQQKNQRERRSMLDRVKAGDKVVTIGGFHGTVAVIDDTTVRLRLSDTVEVTLNRSAIGSIVSDES